MASAMTKPRFIRVRFTWLAYAMLAYFAYMEAVLGPLMPFLRAELNLSYTVGGLHLSLLAVGSVIVGTVGATITRALGRYRMFWSGAFGMAVGGLLLITGSHVSLTLTGSLLMGILGGFVLMLVQSMLSDQHGEQRTIALTEANVAASLAATCAPLLVGGIEGVGFGWRGAILLPIILMTLLYLGLHAVPLPTATIIADTSTSSARLPSIYWLYCFGTGCGVAIEWSLILWGADFLEQVVELSKVNAATSMSLFFAAMLVGRIVGSYLSRHLRSEWLLLLAIGVVLLGFPLFWLSSLVWLNLVGLFVTGLGVANLFPLGMAAAIGAAPTQADTASAKILLVSGSAIALAPLVLGGLADVVGIFVAYSLVPLFAIVALGLTVVGIRN